MKFYLYLIIAFFLFVTSCQNREWTNLYDTNNTLIKSLPSIAGVPVQIDNFNTVSSGGLIASTGGSTITARGICWNTTASPTITSNKTTDGIGFGSFTSIISGLDNNTTYYFRAYATNSMGTSYGNESSVILYMNIPDASITDIDGNVYNTVKIGTQIWMAENYKATRYRNGDTISNVTDHTTWANLTSGAYCDFTNNITIGAIYGHLYNYFTITDIRELCPTGWHIPSALEWTTLLTYLRGGTIAGAALKETGTTHWISPNTATNSSGFTAFAGSWRGGDANFYYGPGTLGDWWSSTSYNTTYSSFFGIDSDNSARVNPNNPYFSKQAGCSIRCVKD